MVLENEYEKYCLEIGLTPNEIEQLIKTIQMITDSVIDSVLNIKDNKT